MNFRGKFEQLPNGGFRKQEWAHQVFKEPQGQTRPVDVIGNAIKVIRTAMGD